MNSMVTKDKYQRALNQVEASEGKKCYQALGKAYILRPHEELKKDYQSLIEENIKEMKTCEVCFTCYFF